LEEIDEMARDLLPYEPQSAEERQKYLARLMRITELIKAEMAEDAETNGAEVTRADLERAMQEQRAKTRALEQQQGT
jgi:predicted ATP-dependent protease